MTVRRLVVLLSCLAVALAGSVVAPQRAEAYLYNLRVGLDGDAVRADDILTVSGTSDLAGGEVCIVAADSQATDCLSPAWGSPNQILTVGSFIEVPIEAPPLKVGRWKVIAVDRNGKSSEAPLEVVSCGDTCNPGPANQRIAQWKASADQTLAHHGALCIGVGTASIGRDFFEGIKGLKDLKNLSDRIAEVDNEIYLAYLYTHENVSMLLQTKANLEAALAPALAVVSADFSRGAMGGIFQAIRDETDAAWGGIMPSWYTVFEWGKPRWWAMESAWTSAKLFANINCRAALMYSDIIADPPDFNYGTVVTPQFRFPRDIPSDGSLSELMRVTDEAQAYGTAARVSVERLQGAEIDGDTAGMRRQAEAGADFQRRLVAANLRQAELLDTVAAEADTNDVWQGTRRDALADLDQWQRRAAAGIITPEERATLKTEYGLSDEAVDNIGLWATEWAPSTIPSVEQRWQSHLQMVEDFRSNGFSADDVAELKAIGATDADIADLRIQLTQQSTDPAELDRAQPERMRSLADELREQAWPQEQFAIFLDMYAARTKAPVTPVQPTVTFITQCDQYGSVTLPTVEGLSYTATPPNAREGEVVVVATALPGYVIRGGAVARWEIDLGTHTACPAESVVAADTSVEASRGHEVQVDLAGLVTASGPVNFSITKYPETGQLWSSGTVFTYRPPAAFVGTVSFTYRAYLRTSSAVFDEGTVTITMLDVNDPPVVTVSNPTMRYREGTSLPSPYRISDPNGDQLTYLWRASSGLTNTGSHPGVLFVDQEADGWLEVEVTDARGAITKGDRVRVEITNAPPEITGTFPVRAVPGVEAQLSLWPTDDGPNDSPVLSWDFGDGGTATGNDVTHTWAAGTYTLTVTATDKDGASTTRRSTVRVGPTVVDAGPDRSVLVGENVAFDFSGSTDIDPWLSYTVDHGDGQRWQVPSLQGVRHRFSTPGDYTVTLTATDRRNGGTETSDTAVYRVRTPLLLEAHVVPGTVRGGSADVQVTAWTGSELSLQAGVTAEFTLGGETRQATTDTDGRAVVRLPLPSGGSLGTVTVTVAPNGQWLGASTTATVTPQTLPAGDIVFLIDESGSMGSSQAAVGANVNTIASQVAGSVDYSLALWGFGGWELNGLPVLHVPATTDLVRLKDGIDALTTNGGFEPGTDAIVESLSPRTGWRPGAGRCVVLIGDEPLQTSAYTAADAAEALTAEGATLFTITTAGSTGEGYRQLAVDSGGADFDIEAFVDDPAPVLSALLQSCATRVAERPDLSVTIDDGVAEVEAGTEQVYVVTARNDGGASSPGTTVTVTLPAELTVLDAAGATVTGQTLTWQVGDLAPGGSWNRSVRAVTAEDHPGGSLAASAVVANDGSLGADPTPADTIDDDLTVVTARPEPSPSPTPDPSPSPSPSPSPDPSPSPSPDPSPSPSPDPSPSPTASPGPTASASPSPSPSPGPLPSQSPSPVPTASPSPTVTANPTHNPRPTPRPPRPGLPSTGD